MASVVYRGEFRGVFQLLEVFWSELGLELVRGDTVAELTDQELSRAEIKNYQRAQ